MRSPSVPPELLFPLWLGTMLRQTSDDRALALNPSLALAWLLSGWVRVWLGEFEEVADRISRSLRLNPADLHSYSMHSALAFAHFFAGRYTEALSWAEMAVREKPSYLLAACIAPLASLWQVGRETLKKP